jgi:nucleolar protein 15
VLATQKMTGGPRKSKREKIRADEVDVVPKLSSRMQKPVKGSSPEIEVLPSEDEYLHGFTSEDDDSSDEEDVIDDTPEPQLGVLKLVTVAKDDATIRRRLELAKRQPVKATCTSPWNVLTCLSASARLEISVLFT